MKTGNGKYVRRGQVLVIHDNPQKHREVRDANMHKGGAPFRYADSLLAALAMVKSMIGLSYKHLQGTLMMTLRNEDAPDHTTIYRRLQSMDINGGTATSSPSQAGESRPLRL